MVTVNIPGVELVKTGVWNSATGPVQITPSDLTHIVTASRDPDIDAAPIKLGHTDPRFDGEPALGWVRNLRLSTDDTTLIGDLTDVPTALADIMATAYPRRSVEIAWGLPKPDGGTWQAVLTGLALLGVTPPAVKGLQDVYRAAASGPVIVALTGDTSDIHPLPGVAAQAGQQTDPEEDVVDDTAASEPDTVEPDTVEPDTVEPDTNEPETGAPATTEPEPAPAQDAAAPATVTLSQATYQELVAGARAGAAALATIDAQRRDGIITTALNEGRLRPADTPAWRAALDRDEPGTTSLLATLPVQTLPTIALGSTAAGIDPGEDAWNQWIDSLTGKAQHHA